MEMKKCVLYTDVRGSGSYRGLAALVEREELDV